MNHNYWQGNKVRLRNIEPEDYLFFQNWNMDSSTQIGLDRIWFPTSSHKQKEWAQNKSLKNGENDDFLFVIEDKEEKPIGSVSARRKSIIDGTFTYGIATIETERQKGYATEAISLVLNYYFNELRYNKVNIEVFSFNTNSQILHEKFGFVKEGQLRESKFCNGKYWDIILYGMTREEFNNR